MSAVTGAARARAPGVGRRRAVVLGAALIGLGVALTLAATSYGTNDIIHWLDYERAIGKVGPIDVYSFDFHRSVYNQPPLIGYFVEFCNRMNDLGLRPSFPPRAVSAACDVVTALLVFELLRARRSLAKATVAGVLVGLSPVLILIAGFHGNTDPIFMMLALLGTYLLVDRHWAVAAGVVLGLCVSIKIVAILFLPALIVWALRRNLAQAVRLAVGLAVPFLALWLPVILTQWQGLRHNVLGYAGIPGTTWGPVQFARWLGAPDVAHSFAGSGTPLAIGCAVGAAIVVAWRPHCVLEATAFSLMMFVLLTGSLSLQYFTWVAVTGYFVSSLVATAFNLAAAGLAAVLYTHWSGGFPWDAATAVPWNHREALIGVAPWATLAVLVVITLWRIGATGSLPPRPPERPMRARHAVGAATSSRVR